jgi:transcription elongation GreA/GreB family factor
VDKHQIVRQIIAQLDAELALSAQSARTAHAEATDDQSKAENKYDTRGLEASYLAHGQSLKAVETLQARQQFSELDLRPFEKGEPIELAALVTLEGDEGAEIYFLGPRAGGIEIKLGKKNVLVITPHSPFGRQLMGRKMGEQVQVELARTRRTFRIAAVE